ncbi:MAG: ABC transporter substrate-binding protein [Aquificaceae bacterium]|nr:ABC transporter substrate-binding protein [Aquificaceae bacterium]MDW8237784.1 ABC transporter substrate-binding protein [Aquificaceae bacterium]
MLGIVFAFVSIFSFHFLDASFVKGFEFKTIDPAKLRPEIGKQGGQVSFVLSSDPKTLNPALAEETSSTAVISEVFSGLTKVDLKTFQVVPDLAQSWEVLENGLVYRFKLKKVYWSDGTPLTADDVVFTFKDVYLNPSIPGSVGDSFKGILKTQEDVQNFVKKIDSHTVEFRLPKPFAPFLSSLSAYILPKHKLEAFVKNGTFRTAWNVNTSPSEIVGTGPFKIQSYQKGALLTFVRNPYYYERDERAQALPYLDKKIAYIIQDPDSAVLKFKTRQVDFINVRPQDIQTISQVKNAEIFDLGPTSSTTFLVFNQNPSSKVSEFKLKLFRNRDFRWAISYAIDREAMCQLVFNGLAKPLYGPITPANRPYFSDDLFPPINKDVAKAKELLSLTGLKDTNLDGWLEGPDGQTLEITLLTNAGNREREAMATMIAKDLQAVGIKVNVRPIDFNSLVTRLTSPPYDWEAVIIGLTGSMDPHFGRNVWHSSGTLHMWNPRQKKPSTDWERSLDELIDKGATELNFEKRVSIYRELYRIVYKEQPMIFLTTPVSMVAINKRLRNAMPTVWGWYKEEALFVK